METSSAPTLYCRNRVRPLPGRACDLVTVPARQGLEAVDILRRGWRRAVGPVLHDDGCDTLGFLVPPGTADGWDMPGSTCTQTDGRGLRMSDARRRAGRRTGCCRRATRIWRHRSGGAARGAGGGGPTDRGRGQLPLTRR